MISVFVLVWFASYTQALVYPGRPGSYRQTEEQTKQQCHDKQLMFELYQNMSADFGKYHYTGKSWQVDCNSPSGQSFTKTTYCFRQDVEQILNAIVRISAFPITPLVPAVATILDCGNEELKDELNAFVINTVRLPLVPVYLINQMGSALVMTFVSLMEPHTDVLKGEMIRSRILIDRFVYGAVSTHFHVINNYVTPTIIGFFEFLAHVGASFISAIDDVLGVVMLSPTFLSVAICDFIGASIRMLFWLAVSVVGYGSIALFAVVILMIVGDVKKEQKKEQERQKEKAKEDHSACTCSCTATTICGREETGEEETKAASHPTTPDDTKQ